MSHPSTDTDGGLVSTVSDTVFRLNQFIRQRQNGSATAQLSIGLAMFLLFGSSIAIIVFYSFLRQAPPQGAYEFTFQNYREFLANGFYRVVLWDSLVIAVKSTLGALLFGYPVAYFLAFTESDRKNLLLLLIILPFWINLVIRTYAWRLILGNKGIINWFLVDILGVLNSPANLLFSQNSIVLGLLHIFLPYMILPIYVSLDNIDRSHIEAAQNLGANNAQAFYEVTLPQSIPGVAAGVVLSFVLGFGAFVVPLLLGGTQNLMIANTIGSTFIELFNWSLGSAIAISVTVFVLAFVFIFNSIVGLEELYDDGGSAQ
ncbi:ABC transporter permease [Haloarchaeobius sp. HME9146]|uniref:ABC transporter permease n=1 Tax=Haloarchaeobius sp. HME9146 TaxID=2978732 RepID=UPI0021BE47EB|nr:ABC transporter permease [Haloarchaeobius sp. HME9146]MCT9098088.1 ABC transporter permease [Haloarchaeobius sp. HME9146]